MSNNGIQYCQATQCRFSWSHVTSSHLCGRCKRFGHGELECGHESAIADLTQHCVGESLPPELHCTVNGCTYKSTHQSVAHHCRLCLQNHSSYDCPKTKVSQTLSLTVLPPLKIECPLCRQMNTVSADQKQVFGVKDQCVVCMEQPCEIFFPQCGHVCLCRACGYQMGGNVENPYAPHNNGGQFPQAVESAAFSKMGRRNGPIYVILSAGMGCSWYLRRAEAGAPLEGFFMHSDSWGQYDGGDNQTDQLKTFIEGFQEII